MAPKVFLARVEDGAATGLQVESIRKAVEATGFVKRLKKLDMVAIKIHVGEQNNTTHVKPELVKTLVKICKDARTQPFLTDTATLYRGQRQNAVRHTLHAHAQGFGIEQTGAPFIAVDGLSGTDEAEVKIDGELHRSVKVAGQILLADALLVLSHATGHGGSGLGAAIKNVGMGLTSRAAKMRQHSSITPQVEPAKCQNCGKCRKWCPTDAIDEREGISYIRQDDCIGCGQCMAVCRFGAVRYNYSVESAILQKSMAEHTAGVLRHFGDKAVHVTVLIDITRDCDCLNREQKKAVPDIGIIASSDIVALEQATLDITAQAYGQNIAQKFRPDLNPSIQIEHAEKMGLGTRKYALVEV